MQRALATLAVDEYDLLVIGGGIYGACIAWEATLQGLSVALVERDDFGASTSSNSLKTIHGGLRYLQHADFRRMRESIRERRTLMQIAPHLVHPLPVLVPTYGHGLQGREVLAVAMLINDLVSFDRNRLSDPQKHIPRGRILSKQACLQKLPGLDPQGLTGGAIFSDAQVYNSERLTLAFLRSAEQAGAQVANYATVTDLVLNQDRVIGATICDGLSQDCFDIRARTVVNASGAWVEDIKGLLKRSPAPTPMRFAKAMNLVTRQLFDEVAVGLRSRLEYRDADALVKKGNRLLFVAPWRGRSIIGTAQANCPEAGGEVRVNEAEVQTFLDEVNQAYPPADLHRDDVSFVHAGYLPSTGVDSRTGDLQLAKHFRIDDHQQDGIQGLLSVTGGKYTTARQVAEKVVQAVGAMQNSPIQPPQSATRLLYGGEVEHYDTFMQQEVASRSPHLEAAEVRRLIATYGSAYPNVLTYLERTPDRLPSNVTGEALLRAEVRHAVREEMAQRLGDVIFRRTELGSAGNPGDDVLRICADVMQAELSWNPTRTEDELQQVRERLALGLASVAT